VSESYFSLSSNEQQEALQYASAQSGRPVHLLEKDLWVVWTLKTLFESQAGADLTFKGGTSLSKAYKIIDRFSEDIDLTCNIRRLIPDRTSEHGELPSNRSQAKKWVKDINVALKEWITQEIQPILERALQNENIPASLELTSSGDTLLLKYPALTSGTGYIAPIVRLEFGGRATGEPHQIQGVVCDMASYIPELSFPTAAPLVMSVNRTFWEKATAAHVYCMQGKLRSERYARHWFDLAAIAKSKFITATQDKAVALTVAQHKSIFFFEKDHTGHVVDYLDAIQGNLKIVPTGDAKLALKKDYAAMTDDGVLLGGHDSFEAVMDACHTLERLCNSRQDS